MLAYGVHDLQEAGVLPGLDNLAFDVSGTIDPSGFVGTLLKGVLNFSPATTWLEAAAWVLYAVPVMTLFVLGVRRRSSTPTTPAPAPGRRPLTPTTEGPPCARPSSPPACCWPPRPSPPAPTTPPRRRRSGDARSFTVASSDDACDVSGAEAPSGALKFEVTNTGSQVTEFYVLADDGLRIVGEVENIGPGVSRSLTVKAPEGDYFTACKPGMKGDGIRNAFTVTGSDDGEEELSATDQQLVDEALAGYKLYVRDQSAQLLEKTASSSSSTRPATGRRGPRALPRRPHPLGAHRDGRGVLRRPRPEDGPARGRPRARPAGPVVAGLDVGLAQVHLRVEVAEGLRDGLDALPVGARDGVERAGLVVLSPAL